MKFEIDDDVWVKGRVYVVNNIDEVAIVEITGFRKNGSKYESFSAVFPFSELKQVEND